MVATPPTAAAKQQPPAASAGSKPPAPAAAGAAGAASGPPGAALFSAAMPKAEIGADRFLAAHPEYDGRGVVVAIFDTGVDPSAAGLQVTSDGKPKILDVVDCTGSGDVDTSTVVQAEAAADGTSTILGASGRTLVLNPAWANPSGKWHVGCRRLFELLPGPLQKRVKEQRRKAFDEAQRRALADASAALTAASAGSNGNGSNGSSNGGGSAAGKAGGEGAAAKGGAPSSSSASAAAASPAAAAAAPPKSELEARLAYLQEAAKNYDDPGPVVDCVLWHDGATWRVALDTSDLHSLEDAAAAAAAAAADSGDSSSSANTTTATASATSTTSTTEKSSKKKGALADFTPLADYAVERRHGVFCEADIGCAYAVKVYDEGSTLSIVVDAGSHGTHVAGIVAAHFPDDPSANGVAPGAQIISMKIGDSRLGSMETGVGLLRALGAVMAAKADVINMSYGEPAARPDVGHVIELAAEAVNKAGIIFVASAGNAGPALGTVGAPGGTSSALLGIGAYVSPALAAAGHSLRSSLAQGQQYTWSSRGPTADGDPGVALSAPGGAISTVPSWTLHKRMLANGTSMSSPCAAGGLALLLSGLKALQQGGGKEAGGQWISPARVRRAVEATATPLGGGAPDAVLTYGRGLLQVDAAFDYLVKSSELDKPDVRFVVSVSGGPGSSAGLGVPRRGVYMRQPHEAAGPATYSVTVTPQLHEDAPVCDKLAIEEHLVLSSSAPWVEAPGLLLLHHNGRSFEVRVDPTALPPGLHYAEVVGSIPGQEWRGPLFRVPVTVVRPHNLLTSRDIDPAAPAAAAAAVAEGPSGTSSALDSSSSSSGAAGDTGAAGGAGAAGAGGGSGGSGSGVLPPHTLRLGPVQLTPGRELRHFVAVPAGATWAELLVRAGDYDTPRVFLLRATQVLPDVRYSDSELRTNLTLSPSSEWSTAFKVVGEATMELTLSQFWSSLGPSSLEVELSFHGLSVTPATAATSSAAAVTADSLLLDAAAGPLKLLVSCPLRRQRVKPEAKLTHVTRTFKPSDSQLEPLTDPRDVLPGGRVGYRLVLQYSFAVTEPGKYKAAVPTTNGYLYDSPLASQLTQVFNARRQLLYTGDAVPEELCLSKGDHSARIMLRHDSLALLEKLKGTCLVLTRKLDSPVTLPVYSSHAAAVTGGSPASETALSGGDKCVMWLGAPPEDSLPKDAAGNILSGTLSLGQLRRGAGAAPSVTPISFKPAPPAPKKDADKAGGDGGSSSSKGPPEQRLSEALRDARLAVYKGLKTAAAPAAAGEAGDGDAAAGEEEALAAQLEAELLAAHPGHLPLLLAVLARREAAAAAAGGKEGDSGSTDAAAAKAARLPVVDAARAVLAAINTTELAAFLNMRAPAEDAAASGSSSGSSNDSGGSGADSSSSSSYKEQKAVRDKEKAALLEALRALLKAQLGLAEAAAAAPDGDAAAAAAAVGETAAQLRQWVDTASEKDDLLLHARVEAAAGRYAGALAACDKLLAPKDEVPGADAPEAGRLKQRCLAALGWRHWQVNQEALERLRFPAKLPPL